MNEEVERQKRIAAIMKRAQARLDRAAAIIAPMAEARRAVMHQPVQSVEIQVLGRRSTRQAAVAA